MPERPEPTPAKPSATDNPLRAVIARAICAKDGGLQSCEGDSRCIDGDMCPYPMLADAAIAAIEASGWVLVPAEPTEAMLNAARDWSYKKYGIGVGNDGATGCYTAMLAARPRDAASTDKEE